MDSPLGIGKDLNGPVFRRFGDFRLGGGSGGLGSVDDGGLAGFAVFFPYAVDVILGFPVGRDPAVLIDGSSAGVVGGQGEAIILVHVLQVAQMSHSRANIFFGVEGVADAKAAGGGGHQLHEALSTGGRDGVGVVIGLDRDDGVDEEGVDLILGRGFLDDPVNAVLTRHRGGSRSGGEADFKGRNEFGGDGNGASDELPGAAVGLDFVAHGAAVGGR